MVSNKVQPEYDGIVVYAKDAMHGLDLVNNLVDKDNRDQFIKDYQEQFKPGFDNAEVTKKKEAPKVFKETLSYDYDISKRQVPNFGPKVIEKSMDEIWPFINRQMLYGHHLGLKGNMKNCSKKKTQK